MDKLGVREVTELLRQEGIPEMILDVFAGKHCKFISESLSHVAMYALV